MSKKVISEDKKVVIKSLVDAGTPYRKIMDITGVSLGYITKIVKQFESNQELIEWYRENKLQILMKTQMDNLALQEAIRDSVTADEIKKWTPDQKARWYQVLGTDYGIKFDKERLEKGESTENIDIILEMIYRVRDEKQEERKKLNQGQLS
jgi:transposase